MQHLEVGGRPQTLDYPRPETVYDALASAIDQAGTEKTELFLAKLARLNASVLTRPDVFQQHWECFLEESSHTDKPAPPSIE